MRWGLPRRHWGLVSGRRLRLAAEAVATMAGVVANGLWARRYIRCRGVALELMTNAGDEPPGASGLAHRRGLGALPM